MKEDVLSWYHFDINWCPFTVVKGKRARRVELDHLIPRSIGGADDERNLWPECYEPVNKEKSLQAFGAHKKDYLKSFVHKDVCSKKSAALLKQYRDKIKTNWIALYKEIYGDN